MRAYNSWRSFDVPPSFLNFNILGKVKLIPGGNDDLTMFFKQLGAGGQDRAISSNENFNCPDGKTTKQEFECTGVKPNTDTKIWGKVWMKISRN